MVYHVHLADGRQLAVGKIVAIAKNYDDHRREMRELFDSGAAADQQPAEEPYYFLKPSSCLIGDGEAICLPAGVTNVHWETELAVIIGRDLKHASPDDAMAAVAGYAVFLDMTARDLQKAAKQAGRPWSHAKGMDTFGPLGPIADPAGIGDWREVRIRLSVNGEVRQDGRAGDMLAGVPALLAHVSRHMRLEAGDVIATGTPAGVGACAPGDELVAELVGHSRLRVNVVAEAE